MNRLKYPQKFLLITLLLLLPLGWLLFSSISQFDHDIDFANRERRGVQYLRSVNTLHEELSEARFRTQSLSTAELLHDSEMKSRDKRITEALQSLELLERKHQGEMECRGRLEQLRDEWETLEREKSEWSSIERDRRYGVLLEHCRGLIDCVGDASNLILDPELGSYYLMDVVVLKLPEALELFQELRLLRLTFEKGKALTSEQRNSLTRLQGLIQVNQQKTRKGMLTACLNEAIEFQLKEPRDDYLQAVNDWLQYLKRTLVPPLEVTAPPEEFQPLETAALEARSRLWTKNADELDSALKARISRSSWKKSLCVGVTFLTLLILGYLWCAFYAGVSRSVADLENAAQKMVNEEVFDNVSLTTRDELGYVADSFNKVARRLREEWHQAREESRRASSAEAQLRESETRLRLVIDNAGDAILTLDALGVISDWNERACALFGWKRSEVLGRPFAQVILAEKERDVCETGLKAYLENGNWDILGRRVEMLVIHRNGTEFPAELMLIRLPQDSASSFSVFVHDITERKQAHLDMQRAQQAAEAASKAKSEFLANMSHEIRTPMNGILGMTELALETDLTREQREYLGTVRMSAEALLKILNDILDFSKIEAGKLDIESVPFELRDLLANVLRTLAGRAEEKGLELLYHVNADTPDTMLGDPVRLRQVVMNLVGNAIKFTLRGEVVVQVSTDSQNDDDIVLHFIVSDTGIGIPHEKHQQIFESFSQADGSTTRKFGGTGLGLSIASQLTALMGGRIWVESEVGKGSKFHFTVRTAVMKMPERSPVFEVPRALVEMLVLIVDDNATNRHLLQEQLKRWRMKPTTVESGSAALELLKTSALDGRPFSLVLLDYMMPEMDGFEVAQRIHREVVPAPVVLMLSSASLRGTSERCKQLNIAGLLTKPIRAQELLETIVSVQHGAGLTTGSTDAGESNAPAAVEPTTDTARKLRILLAEDNPVNQTLVLRLLQKRGHDLQIVGNGKEALTALDRQTFDLVLMDVQMPEMDGCEATVRIREREQPTGRHTPILAMTANAMSGDRDRCIQAGMDGYVSKPIRPQELFKAIDEVAR